MTATLTKEKETVRQDGIPGYAVTLCGQEETSEREPVEISTYAQGWNISITIDRVVTLNVDEISSRVSIFSERGVEMAGFDLKLEPGDQVILYPADHPNAPDRGFRRVLA